MKKLPVCSICNKRKVVQENAFNTAEENSMCLTCSVFKGFCEDLVKNMQIVSNEKLINRRLYLVLRKETRSNDAKLLESVYGDKISRVRIMDK